MTPRKRKSRVYWREQGGERRAWFDGRDYRDVGGKLEPLVPAGGTVRDDRSRRRDPARGRTAAGARDRLPAPCLSRRPSRHVRHRAEAVEYRVEQHLERLGDRLGLVGPFVTGNVTAGGAGAATKNPAPTEVEEGQKLPESGRPDSNRRRPAWEAGILPLNYARESCLTREVNVPDPLAGVKRFRRASDQPRSPGLRAPATPPESSGGPARSPPALPGRHCPACLPASTAPGPRPARTGGRTSPRRTAAAGSGRSRSTD
jgi:hypothetical protein